MMYPAASSLRCMALVDAECSQLSAKIQRKYEKREFFVIFFG